MVTVRHLMDDTGLARKTVIKRIRRLGIVTEERQRISLPRSRLKQSGGWAMIYELLKDEQDVQYFDSLRSAVNHAGFRSETLSGQWAMCRHQWLADQQDQPGRISSRGAGR